MKKRFFGMKLSTILTALVCLVLAFAIWMFVNYRAEIDAAAFFSIPYVLRG